MTNGNYKPSFLKESAMASLYREEEGFCSGEEYLEVHSPTDNSEDSVEVKIGPIKSKRKFDETSPQFSGPLKKRMCQKVKAEVKEEPFRPWSAQKTNQRSDSSSYFRPPSPIKAEAVDLVKKDKKETESRVPVHPQVATLTPLETEMMIINSTESFPALRNSKKEMKKDQRNYKNMTRERRIEANARERTRVHTISAAFETLRHSVPSYSHNQKLSKLSVLRIACSYIMTLSNILNEDDGGAGPSTQECVDVVSKTIQREGKVRKKKDDND